MGHKRKPTAHQKQIRFIAILACVVLMAVVVVLILFLNNPVGGYQWPHWLARHH